MNPTRVANAARHYVTSRDTYSLGSAESVKAYIELRHTIHQWQASGGSGHPPAATLVQLDPEHWEYARWIDPTLVKIIYQLPIGQAVLDDGHGRVIARSVIFPDDPDAVTRVIDRVATQLRA